MATSKEIADLIGDGIRAPSGARDVSYYVGTVLSWDNLTGDNLIHVDGSELPNLRALSNGIGLSYAAGETVLVIKKQTQYFIQGRVSAPGAGAGSSIQGANATFSVTFGTSGAWGDAPGFPNTPQLNAYIGASRLALVTYRCDVLVKAGDTGVGANIYNPTCRADISFAISGASTAAAGTFSGQIATHEATFRSPGSGQTIEPFMTVYGSVIVNSSNLNAGLNTFTMKYRSSQTARFSDPQLVVIPL